MSSISINSLVGDRTVDFNSLRDVANGKQNKGEVDAKFGTNGISFRKINNHVTRTEKNIYLRLREQNTHTNAAVFKAILEHYGRIDGNDAINAIATKQFSDDANVDEGPLGEAFSRLSNPYIKEAFKFLMLEDAKGSPLSRDEMKQLLNLLDGWEKDAGQTLKKIGQKNFAFATKVAQAMNQTLADSMWMLGKNITDGKALENLKELHTIKLQQWYEDTYEFNNQQKVDNQAKPDAQPKGMGETEELEIAKTSATAKTERVEGANAEGTTQISAELMKQLKDIAHLANGSREGKEGGAGFMGVVDGKFVKFLTHSGERSGNIGADLGLIEKKILNEATDNLRSVLNNIAKELGPVVSQRVSEILDTKGEEKNGLKPMLSRKDVAKAITEIAKQAVGPNGVRFNWDDPEVAAPSTVKHTGFKDVLNSVIGKTKLRAMEKLDALTRPLNEAQKDFLKAESAKYKEFQEKLKTGGSGTDDYFKLKCLDYQYKLVTDKSYQNKVYDLFGDICSPITIDEVESLVETFPCLKTTCETLTLKGGGCTPTKGLNQLAGNRNVTLVAGDNTQYQGLRWSNTQEESCFFDVSPITTAIMIKLGYVKPGVEMDPDVTHPNNPNDKITYRKFLYTSNGLGLSKMNTVKGFLLRTFMVSTEFDPNETYKETTLAMCAAPSFGLGTSKDVNNFGQTLYDRQDAGRPHFTGNEKQDAALIRNAKEFYLEIHKQGSKKSFKMKEAMEGGIEFAQFQKSLGLSKMDDLTMIATYGNYVDPTQDPKAAANKLIALLDSGNYKEQLDVAIQNYKKGLQLHTDNWVKLMAATGAENAQHCGIGTKAFRNSAPWIVDCYVKSVVKYGGKLKNHFLNLYDAKKDAGLRQLFTEAFERHQRNVVNILREDRLTDEQIKEMLKANGSTENEIQVLFEYADAHVEGERNIGSANAAAEGVNPDGGEKVDKIEV